MADLFFRLESAASAERRAARLRQLRSLGEIHESCLISNESRITNPHGIAAHIKVGANSAILGDLVLFPKTGTIQIGERCFLGAQSRVWSASSIIMGNYVLISHNVNIHDTSGHAYEWQERRREMDQFLPDFRSTPQNALKTKPIVIEDDVWLGANVVVLQGVRIGRGAIVGASTVVTRHVPEFCVAVGNPMRIVSRIEDQHLSCHRSA